MEESVSHGTGAQVPERRHMRRHPIVAALAAGFLVPVPVGFHRVSVRDTHIERVRLETVPERRHVLASQHQGASVQLRARIYRYKSAITLLSVTAARVPI